MKIYTIKEVSEILRLSPQTIRKYAKEGKIQVLDKPGKMLISESNLDKYINGGK